LCDRSATYYNYSTTTTTTSLHCYNVFVRVSVDRSVQDKNGGGVWVLRGGVAKSAAGGGGGGGFCASVLSSTSSRFYDRWSNE